MGPVVRPLVGEAQALWLRDVLDRGSETQLRPGAQLDHGHGEHVGEAAPDAIELVFASLAGRC
jgi:hypothetical protein